MKERLQKILAAAHGVSRRKAEELIMAGRVRVNSHVAVIGESADPEQDKIEVDGRRLANKPIKTYIALYKPRGYVTTMSDELGRKSVHELTEGIRARLFPVGRLDMDSEGLLLMTNDGEWANRIAHPRHEVEKTYLVTVEGDPREAVVKMSKGMDILDENGEVEFTAAPARAMVKDVFETSARITVTIKEGHNRQVRKMCEACGLKVKRLVRIAIGPLTVQGIKPGSFRHLTEDEIKDLANPPKPRNRGNRRR
ncbi:MAG: rRNA pseudouridine synthase [Clostridia bacterium]|nr:rRNA pseudouridine synthase [Clostridia bacterium]